MNIFSKKIKLTIPIIFFCVFLLSLGTQLLFPSLIGNDGYFYIKLAQLTKDNGSLLYNFPWMHYTAWSQNFTGLHFLSVILYIPFLIIGNLILAAKVATAFFFAISISTFSWVIKKLDIRHPCVWTLLLLGTSSAFLFRMHLSRPLSISLTFLLLGLFSLLNKKFWLLFIVSFFYVWAYDGYLILLLIVLSYIFSLFWTYKKFDIQPFLVSFSGILWGSIINPYFPLNIINEHAISANPIALALKVSPSAEWYPPDFFATLFKNPLLILLFTIYVVSFILFRTLNQKTKQKQQIFRINFLFVTSTAFFFMASMSSRFVEYWVPFLIIALAYLYNLKPFSGVFDFSNFSLKKLCNKNRVFYKILKNRLFVKLRKFYSQKKNRLNTLAVVLVIIVLFNFFYLFKAGSQDLGHIRYESASIWLKNNTDIDSIVFNASWDDFPRLFFVNHHNRYIVGLDILFLYTYDKRLYWTMRGIGAGVVPHQDISDYKLEKFCQLGVDFQIHKSIKNDFESKYIFIDNKFIENKKKRFRELSNILNHSNLFEEVFRDPEYEEIVIYKAN